MMEFVEQIRRKFEMLRAVMDERVTRLWAAAEAVALGPGGSAIVTAATGIRSKRIWLGKRELAELSGTPPTEKPREQRIRRPGAGRKRLVDTDPTLLVDLESLVDPVTRGDPMSPLRWTTKSTTKLADELERMDHRVGPRTVAGLLKHLGYSLQAPKKTTEGRQHPDRNAQFERINANAKVFQQLGQPVISVDTKKKELVGDFKNGGREWQPKGEPVPVRVHDFIDEKLGKAAPYGIYDIQRNEGWVSVGTDHDTSEFAVDSIRQWWRRMGRRAYPDATELLITADGGGSNGYRTRLWKLELQGLANETGLRIQVMHLPPGTSKWNKIEHRMFSHITQNWRGRPLESVETIVNLIGSTTTTTGLRIKAAANHKKYPAGRKVSDEELAVVSLERDSFHGEWNYAIAPNV
jgi:Rhodopirellula transposase DDE domain